MSFVINTGKYYQPTKRDLLLQLAKGLIKDVNCLINLTFVSIS